ncbi:hypothetical protein [Streptomyces sp. NPDC015125]|uniref:hypothetical protein n=1 Tax=Streptomyces sp. NPDC015125 TaxID=3364938 RepID=UPI0037034535
MTLVDVPGDVAEMIGAVYAELYELADDALVDDHERASSETAQAAAADAVAIPGPDNVTDLYLVTDREIAPDQVTTRLGADATRILPIYCTPDGKRWIDPACSHPLPLPATGRKRLDRETAAALVRLTVKAPASYIPHHAEETYVP